MPTYEYRCPAGHDFEKFFRKISDAQSVFACPTCGQEAERRISAGGGLVFKGAGFYLTDYGRNAHRDGNGNGKKPTESPSSTSDASPKSETKSSDSSSTSSPAAPAAAPAPTTKGSTTE